MPEKKFNIRVYAIIFDALEEHILLSDEMIKGQFVTKFPGGGLDWGEGTIDCLKREAIEEMGQEIDVTEHFYTTDFFQKAMFFEDQQLISIYYKATFKRVPPYGISERSLAFSPEIMEGEAFRWFPIRKISPEILTFPIDKKVAEMIKNKYA